MNATPLPQRHTCSTCCVALTSLQAVREHYNSDIHLTHVKKRVGGEVASLPPKVVPSTAATISRYYCSVCSKYFHTPRTLQDHVASSTHKAMKAHAALKKEAKAANPMSQLSAAVPSSESSDAGTASIPQEPLEVTSLDCFFCYRKSHCVIENVSHMRSAHHFTLPVPDKISDLDGLVAYLARKVTGCICLVCGDHSKDFMTLRGVRQHMVHSQHTRIELTEEYSDFYMEEVFRPEPVMETKVTDRGRELVRAGIVVHSDPNRRYLMDGAMQPIATHTKHSHLQIATAARAVLDRKKITESHEDVMAANKQWMRVGIKMNKLHPKGYDGEGTF